VEYIRQEKVWPARRGSRSIISRVYALGVLVGWVEYPLGKAAGQRVREEWSRPSSASNVRVVIRR
jgi:hypothetical protein